jgi:hypothetical protein
VMLHSPVEVYWCFGERTTSIFNVDHTLTKQPARTKLHA